MPDPTTLYDERELLALIAAGDEAAFATLFDRYKDRVYAIAFKLLHTAALAEDIVQEVFLKIWLKRASLVEVKHFNAYLFIITRNDVYKAIKHLARNYKTSLQINEVQLLVHNDTEDYLMGKEYGLLLQQAIERLPNQQKQVYKLIKEQGLKREEVADLLHLRPETVKFHLAQAMKKIHAFYMLQCSPVHWIDQLSPLSDPAIIK